MKQSTKNNDMSTRRKIATYVIVGVLTFTMIFSVFAGLVAAIG